METLKKNLKVMRKKTDRLVMASLYFLAIMAATLLLMAIVSCSKNNTDPAEVNGQNGGKVEGSLKDTNGNPYPNSTITLAKGADIINGKTEADGTFSYNTKESGSYKITVTPPLSTNLTAGSPTSVTVEENKTSSVSYIIEPQPVEAHLNFGDVQLLEEIVDKDGNTPLSPEEPLFAANIFDPPLGLLTPIKAPDGHQVTLSEFKMAEGELLVTCDGNSAKVEISLTGLIPNGTYTFWLAYLNKAKKVGEAIDFMNDFVNPTNPPIGASNGTENIIVAEANGTISATLNHPACILTEEKGLVIPVLYHINGKTFGGGHVPDPEEVVQLLVYFQ